MPPRSLCLNVFTTSLSSAKEKDSLVSVGDFAPDTLNEKHRGPEERPRHDSLHASPNDSTAPSPPYTESGPTTPDDASHSTATHVAISNILGDNLIPSACFTCAQSPSSRTTLLRCSRCKRAYYCSKACQKLAWKTHKNECDPAITSHTLSSGLDTPDMSMPASPTHTPMPPTWNPHSTVSTPFSLPSPE